MEKLRQSSLMDKIRAGIQGAASIFDFGGTLKPRSPYEGLPPDVADSQAIGSDWRAVGNDIRSAIATVGVEVEKKDIRETRPE